MKKLKYLFFGLLATCALAACSDDETSPAEPDVANCYNVYFPSQDNTGDLTLDPSAPTELEFTVMRANDKDAITVPVEILSSEEGIFTSTAIEFAEGQTETNFKVEFPKAALGTTYNCTVAVTDPQYVSKYTDKPAFVKFSLLRAKWLPVDPERVITYEGQSLTGYTWFSDDVTTALFDSFDTFPVKVEVREDTIDEDYPDGENGLGGLYRIIEPWGRGVNVEIDARNPKQVFIRQQLMGLNHNTYGQFVISSLAYYYMKNPSKGDPDEYYGKIENGAIVFPTEALLFAMEKYNDGAFYFANGDGKFRLEVCAAQVVDYSLVLTAGEPENGSIDIAAELGADVAKVKYGFFEGSLSVAQAAEHSKAIDADAEAKTLTETGVVTAQFEKTGVYTMLANIYDKENELQGYKMVSFGYIAADDEKPVVLSCGITITDKYAPQGYTSEDSAEIYIYGEDIVSGSYALIESEKAAAITNMDAYLEKSGKAFTDAQLEKINGTGFSGVIGNLIGGTEYKLIVKAFNGYITDYKTATATTNGTPHPLKSAYTADDLSPIGGGKTALFKKWNYYAKCFNEAGTGLVSQRAYLGQVEFKENENDITDENGTIDVIDATGLTAHVGKQLGFDDTMTFEYDSDIVYTRGGQTFKGATYNGLPLAVQFLCNGLSIYPDIAFDYALVGGLVENGYMAFVSYPDYTKEGYDFNGFLLGAFEDATYKTRKGILEAYNEIMLVDPAVDDKAPTTNKSAVTKTVSMKSLQQLAKNAATPNNFVELRGRERMRALIDEMHAGKRTVRNAAEQIAPVAMPMLGAAEAKVTFKAGIPERSFNPTMLSVTKKATRFAE